MKSLKILLFLVSLSLLTSCAGPRISPETSKNIKDSKIAVAYVQVEKKISHNESLYRVFWWDLRKMDVSFDGLWDLDKDLSNYMVPNFADLGLHPTSIYTVASKRDIASLHKSIKGKNKIALNNSLRQSLKRNNIRYLITLYSPYIYTHTQWGLRQMNLNAILSVIDVDSNEEMYPGKFFPAGISQ